MTHRNTADYYAGIPQYGQQLAAENDRLRTAIREALTVAGGSGITRRTWRECAENMRTILTEAALEEVS